MLLMPTVWMSLLALSFASAAAPGFTYTFPTGTPSASAVDGAGNVYLTGTTFGGLPTTPGAFHTQYGSGTCFYGTYPHGSPESRPCYDAFVIKLDPAGAVLWATYLGGSGDESGTSLITNAS